MHNFFCCSENITKNVITLNDAENIHHIKDVLKLKTGEEVIISDDKGAQYYSIVDAITERNIKFIIIKKKEQLKTKKFLTVGCAIPKKTKFDDIVDKLTQLGVDRIVPLRTERVIVKLDNNKLAQRLVRWRKIALSASQQSQRNAVPEIVPVTGFKDFLLNYCVCDLKLIPTLYGERKQLIDVLSGRKPGNTAVLIGPEGDFSAHEVILAVNKGFLPVSLGESVLRVDTAAIAVTSMLRLYENR